MRFSRDLVVSCSGSEMHHNRGCIAIAKCAWASISISIAVRPFSTFSHSDGNEPTKTGGLKELLYRKGIFAGGIMPCSSPLERTLGECEDQEVVDCLLNVNSSEGRVSFTDAAM